MNIFINISQIEITRGIRCTYIIHVRILKSRNSLFTLLVLLFFKPFAGGFIGVMVLIGPRINI